MAASSKVEAAGAAVLGEAEAAVQAEAGCAHCGLPVIGRDDGFCCGGCRMVHRLLRKEGLERYYALRKGLGVPLGGAGQARDHKWLERYEDRLAGRSPGAVAGPPIAADGADGAHTDMATRRVEPPVAPGETCQLSFDMQGVHCAACVWLVQELFSRHADGASIVVNPALGAVDMTVASTFPLREFIDDVERFGYIFGPPQKTPEGRTDDLLLRTGIAIALAGNTMLFAISIYLGLANGTLYEFVNQISYALAVVSVLVGAPVFVRGAWAGLRRGALHLDVPIVVGITLAFGGSSWAFFTGGGAVYFDSLTVFIALMLLGRFLQERALASNRARILEGDDPSSILVRRVDAEGRAELVSCPSVEEGDTLLVAPGDLIPVDAELGAATALVSLDWIDGESRPRELEGGAVIPAGAFNVGSSAFEARAVSAFRDSSLSSLLRRTRADEEEEGYGRGAFWNRLSTIYVIAVLLAAGGGLVGWWVAAGDPRRGVEVAIAVLVVTCPCAFGIATPLAYEFVLSGLRRAGLFVRTAGFLDRARRVRRVVFDKTGTLTAGELEVDDHDLGSLEEAERAALYDLTARSAHPKSQALMRALAPYELRLRPEVTVVERPGQGLEATISENVHRLGSPRWLDSAATAAAGTAEAASEDAPGTGGDLIYTVDGVVRARFTTSDRPRPDAAREVQRLGARGYELGVLSGDAPARVAEMALLLGLPPEFALGGQSPEDKAAWLTAHDHEDTLFVGDGINDALAADQAFCSGTPAVDRPFMPARTDFYLVTPGLGPVALALRASRSLSQVVRANLSFAIIYNAGAVGLAWAGFMRPWVAAVLMPLSSLAILAFTTWALSARSSLWKS